MSDELDDLKKEVAKLKDQLNPPPRPPSILHDQTRRRYGAAKDDWNERLG